MTNSLLIGRRCIEDLDPHIIFAAMVGTIGLQRSMDIFDYCEELLSIDASYDEPTGTITCEEARKAIRDVKMREDKEEARESLKEYLYYSGCSIDEAIAAIKKYDDIGIDE